MKKRLSRLELVVVLLIVVVIAALLGPAIYRSGNVPHGNPRLADMKMIVTVWHLIKHNEGLPPASLDEVRPHLERQIDLARYELASQSISTGAFPSKVIVCREREPDKDGWRVVGFMDGHVEAVQE